MDGMLQRMADASNFNENSEMDDSFQMSFTHVQRSPRGCGKNRKMKPGHSRTFKRIKQTVVTKRTACVVLVPLLLLKLW